jgi:hypothetical protein
LSYSKDVGMLVAACAWEDWVYNLTRQDLAGGGQRWAAAMAARSPAMAAGRRYIEANPAQWADDEEHRND